MAFNLQLPVAELNKLVAKLATKLKKLGIQTCEDLIFYYPTRYDDFSHIVDIKDLTPGAVATIRGKVELIKNQRNWARRLLITTAIINDGTGSVKVIWFGQYYLSKILAPGDEVFIAGRVDKDQGMIFYSPNYEKITLKKGEEGTTHTGRLVPVYHLTRGLTSKQLRYVIKLVLLKLSDLPDYLPVSLVKNLKLLDLKTAIKQIHFPLDQDHLERASRRLKFDEIFLIQLRNQMSRRQLLSVPAYSIPFAEESVKSFVASLPFKLTTAQRKAAWEILQDLQKGSPMNRLLEGDVGSGKTVVAALVLLNVALAGAQGALMAPTEILAKQHYATFKKLLLTSGVRLAILTRTESCVAESVGETKLTKKEILDQIKRGRISLVIGTHALIQEKLKFKKLALAVVDEQHRFGVDQRRLLQQESGSSGVWPHFLSMTATPIPRTLALTLYGDLDLSLLNEMPQGRKKIISKIVAPENRAAAYKFIRAQIEMGRQAFVICPLIEESDKLGVKSVKAEFLRLDQEIFPDLTIGILHGKLKPEEKEKVMSEFLAGKVKILVATSVVEVGVDVPNASVMMIEGAQRFGLAQLHQFRGRVGRSVHQSYCFLLTESDGETTQERLSALVNSQDGFKLAEYDLKFRGAGDLRGTAQSGVPQVKLASLLDLPLIKEAQKAATWLLETDFNLDNYPQLKRKVGELADIHWE